jgi:hypothetical protein
LRIAGTRWISIAAWRISTDRGTIVAAMGLLIRHDKHAYDQGYEDKYDGKVESQFTPVRRLPKW